MKKNFASILTRLHVGFKLWTHIHPSLNEKYNEHLIQQTQDAFQLYKLLNFKCSKMDKWKFLLLSLCNGMNNEEYDRILKRLQINDSLSKDKIICKSIVSKLKSYLRTSNHEQIWIQEKKLNEIFMGLSSENLVYLMALLSLKNKLMKKMIYFFLVSR